MNTTSSLCNYLMQPLAVIINERHREPRTHGECALRLDGGSLYSAMVSAIGRAVRSRNKREGLETFEANCIRALAHVAAFDRMVRGTGFILWDFAHSLLAEANRSCVKYPDGGASRVCAIAEELGELADEIDQSLAARDLTKNFWIELTQVAAMVYRLMMEGYPTETEPKPGPSPEPPAASAPALTLTNEVILADALRSVLTTFRLGVPLSLRVPPPLALEVLASIAPQHGIGVQFSGPRIVLFALDSASKTPEVAS